MKYLQRIFILTIVVLVSLPTYAGLILQADFKEELSLPFLVGPDIRTLEADSVLISPLKDELNDSDQTSNNRDYSGHADINLTADGLLDLIGRTPDDFADYQLAIFTISNIVFDVPTTILGVTTIGLGNELFSNERGFLQPLPLVEYTNNSVTITYAVGSALNEEDEFEFVEGQSAQFQLLLSDNQVKPDTPPSNPVPAPSNMLLLGLGLIALRWKQKRSL